MKRVIIIALAAIAILTLGACATEEEFVVRVAVENAYLPFNYIDPETGEPAGWDYEVWDEICRRLGCTPDYVETSWEGMIQAVADGQFDAAADGITITEGIRPITYQTEKTEESLHIINRRKDRCLIKYKGKYIITIPWTCQYYEKISKRPQLSKMLDLYEGQCVVDFDE